jgi:hypothetical protein
VQGGVQSPIRELDDNQVIARKIEIGRGEDQFWRIFLVWVNEKRTNTAFVPTKLEGNVLLEMQ